MKTKLKTGFKSSNQAILENSNFLNSQNYVINILLKEKKLSYIKKIFLDGELLKIGINRINKSLLFEMLKKFLKTILEIIGVYVIYMSIFLLIIFYGEGDFGIILGIIFVNIFFIISMYYLIINREENGIFIYKLYKDKDNFIINKLYKNEDHSMINKYYPKKYYRV